MISLLLCQFKTFCITDKGQIPLRYLVADRSEGGRRQVRGWLQTGPKLVADLLARASSLIEAR